MPELQAHPRTLDRVFDAIADTTRRSILERLRAGPMTVTAIAHPYSMSFNAVSKHVKKLEDAGLIRRKISGREHFCHLNAARLEPAVTWMNHYQQFWTSRLDALEEHLIRTKERSKK